MLPVNDYKIAYDDVGEGNVPIIFLHGFPFDKTMWLGQLDFLKLSYRLIACDIRGFGLSADENTPLSIDLFGDDLIAFMDTLHLDKAIVCGLSIGGFIALNAHKRFPGRFEALILCNTKCTADSPEAKAKRYKDIDVIRAHGIIDFTEEFISHVFCKDSLADKKELVDQLKSVVLSNPPNMICKGLAAIAERPETCSTLNDINIPTLIISGREDEVTPLADSEFMHQHIKESLLHVIDHAGHVSNLEQPLEFNRHLSYFLAGLPGVGAEELNDN